MPRFKQCKGVVTSQLSQKKVQGQLDVNIYLMQQHLNVIVAHHIKCIRKKSQIQDCLDRAAKPDTLNYTHTQMYSGINFNMLYIAQNIHFHKKTGTVIDGIFNNRKKIKGRIVFSYI